MTEGPGSPDDADVPLAVRIDWLFGIRRRLAKLGQRVGFEAAATAALALVQTDLDSTGHDEFRMDLAYTGADDTLVVALADGAFWGGSDAITSDLRGANLLVAVAASAQDLLVELALLPWPTCTSHDGRQLQPTLTDGQGLWYCVREPHQPSGPIGGLTTQRAR